MKDAVAMKQPPPALRAYIAAITVAAVVAIGALVIASPAGLGARDLLIAAQVVALVALARCYPVHLAPKTKLSLDTAPTLAALILLPGPLAVISVAGGMLVG